MQRNQIILLSKCVERRFAEMMFYNGILHFGYPSEWIKTAEEGNVGQGDLLEGVYTNENKFWNFFRRWFPKLVRDKETGTKYLRSRSIVNWPCLCLYSVGDQTKPVGKDGDYMVYDMSEAYAQDFAGKETWEKRFVIPFKDRKAMVVIHRPQAFLKKVKDFFEKGKGLTEGRDYYIGCVQYRKKKQKFTYKKFPTELFYKDARFEKQQEFRIILNPESLKVKAILDEHHNVDMKCSLEDCAMLKTHFYKGARIMVKGDEVKRLEVRDFRNLWGPLHEMEIVPLLNLYALTLSDTIFKLDGGRKVNGSVLNYEVRNLLKSKYQATISGGMIMAPGGGYKTIVENEEKDSYFYLRKYSGGETSWFEGVLVHTSEGIKEYTHLVYDIDGIIVLLLNKNMNKN